MNKILNKYICLTLTLALACVSAPVYADGGKSQKTTLNMKSRFNSAPLAAIPFKELNSPVIPRGLPRGDFINEEEQEALFKDVLAETDTPLLNNMNMPNRRNNIILACGAINETVVMPGCIFSFNQTVGKRTEERGYKSAPAYINGRVAESVGGGICQVASTLYYACLLSNFEIVERAYHSMTADYTEKPGVDATVYWGAIDYKFKNNTNSPVKIFAWVENITVCVKIMGVKTDNNTVFIESNTLSSTPFNTVYRENPNLAPGQTRVVQEPFTGSVVETYRVILDENGKVISRAFEAKSIYKKLDMIIERGL